MFIKILKKWLTQNYRDNDFVALGNLNYYLDDGEESLSGNHKFLNTNGMENVVERLPMKDRWTHYFAPKSNITSLNIFL